MVLKNMEIFPLSLHSQRNGRRASYPSDLQPFQRSKSQRSRRWKMDEPLKLYRLVPIATDDDPNWLDAKSHGEVFAAARSAGDARIVVTERELDFMDIDTTAAEDKTTGMASVFRNEKLYTVIEVNNGKEYRRRRFVPSSMGTITKSTIEAA
jgi:hypothetical protein